MQSSDNFLKINERIVKEDYLVLRHELVPIVAHRLQAEKGNINTSTHTKKFFHKLKTSHIPPTNRSDSRLYIDIVRSWKGLNGMSGEDAKAECLSFFYDRKMKCYHEYFKVNATINNESESDKTPHLRKVLVLSDEFILLLSQHNELLVECPLCQLTHAYWTGLATLKLVFRDEEEGEITHIKIIRCGNLDLVEKWFKRYKEKKEHTMEGSVLSSTTTKIQTKDKDDKPKVKALSPLSPSLSPPKKRPTKKKGKGKVQRRNKISHNTLRPMTSRNSNKEQEKEKRKKGGSEDGTSPTTTKTKTKTKKTKNINTDATNKKHNNTTKHKTKMNPSTSTTTTHNDKTNKRHSKEKRRAPKKKSSNVRNDEERDEGTREKIRKKKKKKKRESSKSLKKSE